MTIQQAIEKAIEGGWLKGSKLKCISEYDGSYIPKVAFFTLKSDETSTGNWHRDVLALISDHLFWQSLGKAMGWRIGYYGSDFETIEMSPYLVQWHRFIDHLAEGGTPESFFESLNL